METAKLSLKAEAPFPMEITVDIPLSMTVDEWTVFSEGINSMVGKLPKTRKKRTYKRKE